MTANVLAFPVRQPDRRAARRRRVECALQDALDAAHLLVAYLDHLDGDPDDEDDGTAEPELAALLADGAQLRWAGFDNPRTGA